MTIRTATQEDAPVLFDLIKELAVFERLEHQVTGCVADLANDLGREPSSIFALLGIEDGSAVGYALMFSTYSTFRTRPGIWLEDLYIRPEHRGKGFGKQLLTAVREFAEQRQAARLEWSVLDWNANAIQLYEKFGATVLPDWRICRIDLA